MSHVWKHFKNVFKLDSSSCSCRFADFSSCDRVKISISWEQPIQPPLAERVSWIFTEIYACRFRRSRHPGLQTCFNVRNTAVRVYFWLRYERKLHNKNPLLLPVLWVLSIERPSVSRWGVEAGCTESRNLNHLSVVQTASSCFKTRLCSRIYWARLLRQPVIRVYMVGPSRHSPLSA